MQTLKNMNQRELVQLAIRQCDKCDLGVGVTPVPFYSPVARPTVAVIGHGPGHKELDRGVPWVGPSGRITRRLLSESDIDTNKCMFLNVVCCGDKPAKRHVEACRSNFETQLASCAPLYAVVFGALATESLVPFPVTLGAIRGRWWKLTTGQWAMTTHHPASIMYRGSTYTETVIKNDLARFAESVILGDLKPPKVDERCLECYRWAEGFIQGIGFCSKHYPKKLKKKGTVDQLTLFEGLE